MFYKQERPKQILQYIMGLNTLSKHFSRNSQKKQEENLDCVFAARRLSGAASLYEDEGLK